MATKRMHSEATQRFMAIFLVRWLKVFLCLVVLSVVMAILMVPAWVLGMVGPDNKWLEASAMVLGVVVSIIVTIKVYTLIRWDALKKALTRPE